MKRMTSKGKSTTSRGKLLRLIKLPIRALSRARDFYVRSMVDCGQVSRYPSGHGVSLPRSFSVTSSVISDDHRSEDFKELIRAASVKSLSNSIQVDLVRRVARSASVGVGNGMGRIDEEKVLEIEDDETKRLRIDGGDSSGGRNKQSGGAFWRSKSYAVTTKSVAL